MIKTVFLYSLLLISPFALLIGVNEYHQPKELYDIKVFENNLKAYNTDKFEKDSCSWYCHSKGCKHKNSINNGSLIPQIYDEIIAFNDPKNGDIYKIMNIIFLVILWPLLMFILIVANIELFLKRRNSLK
ncbi:MAG: hypothetical protein ACOVQG_07460 [Crocinitomicaceae bacterium]|jgi:hypothetical protein